MNTEMNEVEEANYVIGLFMNNCATFEYLINIQIELIFDSPALIDLIQQMPVSTRWKIVSETIRANPLTEETSKAFHVIEEGFSFYNEHIKPKRDFIAHNPLMTEEGMPPRAFSGRRYKETKQNSLEISELAQNLDPFGKHIQAMTTAFPKIHHGSLRKVIRRDK